MFGSDLRKYFDLDRLEEQNSAPDDETRANETMTERKSKISTVGLCLMFQIMQTKFTGIVLLSS